MPLSAPEKSFWRAFRARAYQIDQSLGWLVFGSYKPLSYFAALARDRGAAWGCILCRLLDRIERDHCGRALKNNTPLV